jgi:hypothetical protein
VELLTYLAAGGDVSTMVLVYLAWRFDKRVFHLELINGVK